MNGLPVLESWLAPRGSIFVVEGDVVVMHPSELLRLRNNGRVPFWSAHTRGERERQRDRRHRRG